MRPRADIRPTGPEWNHRMTPQDPISLAGWRRTVAETYATVRQLAPTDPERAWHIFRTARDTLFRSHPQTPLTPDQQARFAGLSYYPYDPAWRLTGRLNQGIEPATFTLDFPTDGRLQYTRIARVSFSVGDQSACLNLYWIKGYGGGLFLPFTDGTSGPETYGGGRYLFDTIKGADLGLTETEIVLDFNFAYNPSCAYDARWVCPLSPSENSLRLPVRVGEKLFQG
jgi:uncharacterized protein (DUF1684 family)